VYFKAERVQEETSKSQRGGLTIVKKKIENKSELKRERDEFYYEYNSYKGHLE
jgi:hypothetical protein